MLAVIGVDSLDELATKAVPAGILDRLTDGGAAPGLDQLPPTGFRFTAAPPAIVGLGTFPVRACAELPVA